MKQLKINRLICLCMAILLTLGALYGCKGKGEGTAESSSQSVTDTAAPPPDEPTGTVPEGLVFGTELLPSFRVVYSDTAEEELVKAAQQLAETISKTYGVEVKSNSDYLREGSAIFCEAEYEILVGKTNRTVNTDFYSNMLAEDRGYTAVGTKILVCGGNEFETISAISDFSYNAVVLSKGKYKDVFYTTEYDSYVKGTYDISSLMLNGTSIKDYTVVYPQKSSGFEEMLADRLIESIKRLTGYTLTKKDDKSEDAGPELIIGKTARDPSLNVESQEGIAGTVAAKGDSIALYGGTAAGNAEAVNALLSMIKTEAEGKKDVSLSISEPISALPDKTVSVMSYNVAVSDISVQRRQRVLTEILAYLPDIIGAQEVNPTWNAYLNQTLSDYYGSVGDGREGGTNGERCLIMYSKERFELIETATIPFSGKEGVKEDGAQYVRIYTYAILKDKQTGERFMLLNTHLDTANDAVRSAEVAKLLSFLKVYTDMPVILTGDLNCGPLSTPIKKLLETSFESVFSMTQNTYLSPNIDWIMTTETGVTVNMARICDERVNGYYTSDHYPVYSELVIKAPEDMENCWDEIFPVSPDGYLQLEHDKAGKDFEPVISFDQFYSPTEAPEAPDPDPDPDPDPKSDTLESVEDTEGRDYYPIEHF